MIGYMNSDFTGSETDKKLIEVYVFILAKDVISHLLKFQLIISLFTCKAEYITIYEGEKKTAWLRYLLTKLKFQKKSTVIKLYTDNQDFIALLNNSKFYY